MNVQAERRQDTGQYIWMRLFMIILSVFLLTSCVSMNLEGRFDNGSDSFRGTVSGSLQNSGGLSFTTESGTLCEGTYQFADGRKTGAGSFTCLDKTTGKFTLTTDGGLGTKGRGSGKTNKGDSFSFTFGE